MQTQKEQWLSFAELARMFQLPAERVSTIVYRSRLETKINERDRRKRLVRLSEFKRVLEGS